MVADVNVGVSCETSYLVSAIAIDSHHTAPPFHCVRTVNFFPDHAGIRSLIVVLAVGGASSWKDTSPSHGQFDFCSRTIACSLTWNETVAVVYKCTFTKTSCP
jgi:hypothetical protein